MEKAGKYSDSIANAISQFWKTRTAQHDESADKSNRGSVTAGKQLDGFIDLLCMVAMDCGVPRECIYTKNNYLPGFFRASKDWDFLIISPKHKLLAVAELKSQVGSYGNNLNNRTEEALGSAVDLWTAFRDNQYPNQLAPWVGYLMVVGDDEGSNCVVRNYEPHFKVRPEFASATYIDRYRLLCQKLVTERHYTSAALIATRPNCIFKDVSADVSVTSMLNSLSGYLHGVIDEFV